MSPTNPRILLVDDHGESLVVLAKLLKRCGYAVQTAGNYAEAMDAAGRERVDLLISDLGLPDRSGLELMHEMQARCPFPLKGIALSGFTDDQDVRASHEAGYLKHLNKPVVFSELLSAIEEVTGWCPPEAAAEGAAFHRLG